MSSASSSSTSDNSDLPAALPVQSDTSKASALPRRIVVGVTMIAVFIGGMLVGHLVTGAVQRDKERTAATMDMAYGQRTATTTYVQQPAYAPQLTAEQRLHQLDKLAAGGYITKEEYKTRRQAILDSM